MLGHRLCHKSLCTKINVTIHIKIKGDFCCRCREKDFLRFTFCNTCLLALLPRPKSETLPWPGNAFHNLSACKSTHAFSLSLTVVEVKKSNLRVNAF